MPGRVPFSKRLDTSLATWREVMVESRKTEGDVRIERDSMGEMRVPAAALYGAQTQRAVENFPISDLRWPRSFIRALSLVKWAAAQVNRDLGLLPADKADAVVRAAREAVDGRWDHQFVVDLFQTGGAGGRVLQPAGRRGRAA